MSNSLKAFITYSHKDLQRNTELKTRLAVMEDAGEIKIWDDNKILPGDEWEKDISDNLTESNILLYLVSATSLASKNCNKELAEVLTPNIGVIPIILEACDWENHQLSRFEALPHKGKPINEWRPQSKGWQNVVDGIRKVVDKMQSQTDSASGAFEDELLAELAFQQGNVLMMLGQIDSAIEAYSHAIELNPNDAVAYSNRGVAYSNKSDFDRATQDFSKAIELQPDFAVAYSNRGVAYNDNREYSHAIKDCNKAIELQPNFALAYYNRGVVYRDTGKHDLAFNDFDKTIELQPDFAKAYNNRGLGYSDKGDSDRAIEDFDKTIELTPDDAIAYSNRGGVYGKVGDHDRAIGDYTEAIVLKPNFAEAYYNRGVAYATKEDYEHAIADFNTVIALNLFFREAYYKRGVAWLYLGEWDIAKLDLTAARNMRINIIAAFRNDYGSVADFERITGVQLPADLAAMLTP